MTAQPEANGQPPMRGRIAGRANRRAGVSEMQAIFGKA
jgi:hypothetical protein